MELRNLAAGFNFAAFGHEFQICAHSVADPAPLETPGDGNRQLQLLESIADRTRDVAAIDRQNNPCAWGGTTFAKRWSWLNGIGEPTNLTIANAAENQSFDCRRAETHKPRVHRLQRGACGRHLLIRERQVPQLLSYLRAA